MNINLMVLELLESKIDISQVDMEKLNNGINQFIIDNKLDQLTELTSNGCECIAAIKVFMKPLLEMKEKSVQNYFEYYVEIKQIKEISRNAMQTAIRKYNGEKIDKEHVQHIKDELLRAFDIMGKNKSVDIALENEISEALMDLRYSGGECWEISMRMRDYIDSDQSHSMFG